MPRNTLRAASGQHTEADTATGPESYNTGGFTLSTNLGRVDEADVGASNSAGSSFKAQLNSVESNNQLLVTAHSEGSGTEVAADTDLSGVNFTYTAYRL